MENDSRDILESIPIKWDDLVNICGDEEMVDAIIDVFQDEGVYALEMIEKAASDRDAADLKLYCHRMKGTARYLGDEDFVNTCLEAELAAQDGKVDEAVELSKRIRPVTEKYLEFFSRPDWAELLKEK
ncbi:MAG: Hpt domain-containing protein [Sedimentisphaeraceae bacterium JB056]